MSRAVRERIASSLAVVEAVIRTNRFRFSNEGELQEGLALALARHEIPSFREIVLDEDSRIDFLLGGLVHEGVGIEVKTAGSLAALTRQVHRYLHHDRVQALIVVTNRSRLRGLPAEINGKPLRTVQLLGGLL